MKIKNIAILGIVIISLIAYSCGGGANTSNDNKVQTPLEKLSGSWKITEAEGLYANINVGTIYSFDTDFNFSSKLGIIESKGVILNIDEEKFQVEFEGMQTKYDFNYSFENEKLIIEPANSDQKFVLEKQ